MARLLLFQNEEDNIEFVVIETLERTDKEIIAEFGLAPHDEVYLLDDSLGSWPTDRPLMWMAAVWWKA